MTRIVACCPAKLNLTFEILGTISGGYHEIATLYQTINLEDELIFELEHSRSLSVQIQTEGDASDIAIPLDHTNLVSRAVQLFTSTMPGNPGLNVKAAIKKNIPAGAGLAGGSSNAAATLLALNNFFGNAFSRRQLNILGRKLGADVPFCLEGGTLIGRGAGDDLSYIAPVPSLHFVLIKPAGLSISSTWAYEEYDRFSSNAGSSVREHGWRQPDINAAVSALKLKDPFLAAQCFGNAFEPVIFTHYPQLSIIKEQMLKLGAWCCHLTGKGPTMYAVVSHRQAAETLKEKFRKDFQGDPGDKNDNGLNCYIVNSVSYGARLTSTN